MQKLEEQGYLRAGIFAKCNFQLGAELTIHYQIDMNYSRRPTTFYCVLQNCGVNI